MTENWVNRLGAHIFMRALYFYCFYCTIVLRIKVCGVFGGAFSNSTRKSSCCFHELRSQCCLCTIILGGDDFCDAYNLLDDWVAFIFCLESL